MRDAVEKTKSTRCRERLRQKSGPSARISANEQETDGINRGE